MKARRYSETEVAAVADELLEQLAAQEGGATVVGLSGELGAGKTTLVQHIARRLGVEGTAQSPTFVIAKFYPTADERFSQLIHIDAYRIEDVTELAPLGWESIIATPGALVIVEWPERIASSMPEHAIHFSIAHDDAHRIINHAKNE